MRKSVKFGKHVIQLWVFAVVCLSIIGSGVLATYVISTLSVPIEIAEPLEVLSYPSHLNLYPGESQEFDVTINNSASATYDVAIICSLDNATYQENYVVFPTETYKVVPGQRNLVLWLSVKPDAPSTAAILDIAVQRVAND